MKSTFVILCLLGAVGSAPAQWDQRPTHGAYLQIEAGTHVGNINRISTDAKEEFLLTSSEDKTARLWQKSDGVLLRTFRPPQGDGREGALYSCALSPDGAFAAAGGICPEQPEEFMTWVTDSHGAKKLLPISRHEPRNFVFVYSTATGLPVQRLEGTLGNVTDLAFSDGGRYLACTGGGQGVRLWDTALWKEIGRDDDYNDQDSYGLDWHGDQRLVSTCVDGHIRLYGVENGKLRLLKKTSLLMGKIPYAARFSPDGREIAVSYADVVGVAILDAETLELRAEPDVSGKANRPLQAVAWSSEGDILYAAGRADGRMDQNEGATLLLWRDKGRGAAETSILPTSPVRDLRGLASGGLLFCGATTWGRRFPDGTIGTQNSPLPKFDSAKTQYRLPDGQMVSFPIQKLRVVSDVSTIAAPFRSHQLADDNADILELKPDFVCAFTFSIPERRLDLIDERAPTKGFREADTTSLPVTQWEGEESDQPQLDRKPLQPPLNPHEFAKSLTIPPGKDAFFLGTEWNLYKYAAAGDRLRWRVPVPSAMALNISSNGQRIVAACGDGTIRWYDASTGSEILRLISFPIGQRWALVTPQGFYDCSPGSDDLLGWFVNEADHRGGLFYPLSCFRQLFYRPELISNLLQSQDFKEALEKDDVLHKRPPTNFDAITEILNSIAPPKIELITGGVRSTVTVPSEDTNISVQYRLKVAEKDIHSNFQVTARYCGRPIPAVGPMQLNGTVRTQVFQIPRGMPGSLTLHARNEYVFGDPAVLDVRRLAKKDAGVKLPKLHVFAVGVSHTADGLGQPLPSAASSAENALKLFSEHRGAVLDKGFALALSNDLATTARIEAEFGKLIEKSEPTDVAIIYIATHGFSKPGEDYSLQTYDSSVDGAKLGTWIDKIPARTLLILDTCHSAAAFLGKNPNKILSQVDDLNQFVSQLSTAELGTAVISSCGIGENGYADPRLGSYLLQTIQEFLEADKDKAPPAQMKGKKGCVELQTWVTSKLPARVRNVLDRENRKHPGEPPLRPSMPACVLPKGVSNFPIASAPD